MRRLHPLDRVLLAVLVPIWAVCFGLCLRAAVEHPPVTPPVGVQAGEAGGYPIVIDFRPDLRPGETDLRRGDRLLQVGDVDLRGLGPLGFYARFVAEAEHGRPPPKAVYERDGRRTETTFPAPLPWPTPLVLSLGFFFTAAFLYLRAPPSPLNRSVSRKHRGSVVEFNGDGMMAVFGAPRAVPHKGLAAVDAGREIAAAVGELPVPSRTGADGKLSVGVGIATGEAFVGNLRAADRMIWSAIGNTTNLAARLQGLSRELGAAIVIDAATRASLGRAGDDFDRHEATAIRGRSNVQDVYSLALAASQGGSSERHPGA